MTLSPGAAIAPTSSGGIAFRWLRGLALCLSMLACPTLAQAQGLDAGSMANAVAPDADDASADLAPPDANRELLRTINPEIVAGFIESSDFYTDVSVDPSGYPVIYADPGDTSASSIGVAFMRCSVIWPDECSAIDMVASFSTSAPITPAVIKRWNATHHPTRASLGPDGSILLSLVIDTHGSLGRDTLHAQISRFIDDVYAFGDTLVLDLL